MPAKIIWEHGEFKVLRSRRDFVLVRKGYPYEFHAHFKDLKGCKTLVKLFEKKKIPFQEYYKLAMERITTEEEREQFTPQRKKLYYFNSQKGVRR
jgi:hypothetical protein